LWTRLLSNTQHTEHLLDEASEEFKFVINIGESDHEFSDDLSDHKNDGDVSGVDYYLSHLDLFFFFTSLMIPGLPVIIKFQFILS
jgi:hypothetical protein